MEKTTKVTPAKIRNALKKDGGNITYGEGTPDTGALPRLAHLLGVRATEAFCSDAIPALRRMQRKGDIKVKYQGGKISEIKLVGYTPAKRSPRVKGMKPRQNPRKPHLALRDEGQAAGEYVPDSDKVEPEPWEYIPEISPAGIAVTTNGQPTKAKTKRSKNLSTKLTHYR